MITAWTFPDREVNRWDGPATASRFSSSTCHLEDGGRDKRLATQMKSGAMDLRASCVLPVLQSH